MRRYSGTLGSGWPLVGHRARATGCVPGVVGDDADVSGTVTDGATLEQFAVEWPGGTRATASRTRTRPSS